jgi:hypothetical protein
MKRCALVAGLLLLVHQPRLALRFFLRIDTGQHLQLSKFVPRRESVL